MQGLWRSLYLLTTYGWPFSVFLKWRHRTEVPNDEKKNLFDRQVWQSHDYSLYHVPAGSLISSILSDVHWKKPCPDIICLSVRSVFTEAERDGWLWLIQQLCIFRRFFGTRVLATCSAIHFSFILAFTLPPVIREDTQYPFVISLQLSTMPAMRMPNGFVGLDMSVAGTWVSRYLTQWSIAWGSWQFSFLQCQRQQRVTYPASSSAHECIALLLGKNELSVMLMAIHCKSLPLPFPDAFCECFQSQKA